MSSSVTATFVFTDLVDSTATAAGLDHDAAEELRQTHFRLLRGAVAGSGGTEVKNLGDGLMVMYSSSSPAVAGAVAMQQAIEHHNRSAEHPLGVRVGMSAGEAVEEDGDYFGDPVVEAARVCALCDGGQIVVTEIVRLMAGRRITHPFTELGDHELKGLPDPVPLFEVGWVPAGEITVGIPLPDRLETDSSTALFGFLGRQREKMQLFDAVKSATTGSRQVAFLSGEPGIGKTSLCRQVAQRARELDVCVLYGRCDEDLGVSYQPFGEALSHLAIHANEQLLEQHVADHGGALLALVPALSKRLPDTTEMQSADPDTQRERLFNAVVGLLAAAAADHGLLLVVDDLHWADKATLQLLRHAATSHQLAKVMILGTYRDSDLSANNPLSDVLASLRREGDVQRIDLVGLDDLEVIEMMEAAAGHEMPEEGVALGHAVRQETEGNPFFTAEMLIHLGESGLVRQDETGRWVATDDLYEQGLPQSVREVVGQRIDRLGDEHRRVLSQAAVIGRDFDVELLAMVADIDEDHLLDLLDQAGAAGLVTEVEGAVDRFSFTHALTQHTLYDDLGASRRARAHRRIAEALETLCGATPQARAGELARHFVGATKAADIAKALEYTQMAGNQALAQLAPADALGWFAQALDLHGQSPSDGVVQCDLLIGLGTAQRQTGDPAHRETLLQAANIAKSLGDTERLVQAALAGSRGGSASRAGQVDSERVAVLEDVLDAIGTDDSEIRARLLAMLAVELSYSGQRERIAALINESMTVARRLDDPLAFLRAASAYGAITLPENLDARLVDLAEALSTAAAIGDPSASFDANYSRALACFQAGNRAALEAHLDACASLAEQLDRRLERWMVTGTRSELCVISGDLDAAEELANDALTVGADSVPEALTTWGGLLLEIRDVQGRLGEMVEVLEQAAVENPGLPILRAALGRTYCELDRPADALALIQADVNDKFAKFEYDNAWLTAMALMADVCVQLEQHDVLPLLYEQLGAWHAQWTALGPAARGPVALYLAMLAGALDDYDRAERHFNQAFDMSQNLEAPYWTARTQYEWAKVLRRRHEDTDEPRAAKLLTSATNASNQYGFTALAQRADSLL